MKPIEAQELKDVADAIETYVPEGVLDDGVEHRVRDLADKLVAEAVAENLAEATRMAGGNCHDDLLAACKAWVDYFDALTRHDEPGDRLAEARKSVHGARVEATRAAIRKAQPQAVRP